jgi:hypothetical protein
MYRSTATMAALATMLLVSPVALVVLGTSGAGSATTVLGASGTARTAGVQTLEWNPHEARFVEYGLPTATNWSIAINGSTYATSSNNISVSGLPLGPNSYSVGAVTGFYSIPTSGVMNITPGVNQTSIIFHPVKPGPYGVTFTETGLPAGTSWLVMLDGVTQTSIPGPNTVVFHEANGTYQYSVQAVSGYYAGPSSGAVTVLGVGVTVNIAFTSIYASTPTGSSGPSGGIPTDEVYGLVAGGVIAAAAVGVAIGLNIRGKHKRSAPGMDPFGHQRA